MSRFCLIYCKTNVLLMACVTVLLCACTADKKIKQQVNTSTILESDRKNIDSTSYQLFKFIENNKPCYAIVSDSFKNFKYKQLFPYRLLVKVESKDKDKDGLPTGLEMDHFNKLEDNMIDYFLTKFKFCYIVRTTIDSYREVIFYVQNEALVTDVVKDYISYNKYQRNITFEIERDDQWEGVQAFYAAN